MNDLDLMYLRTDALFTYDERGRMLCDNDPGRRPAPRIYLAYTMGGYVIRFGQGISDANAIRLRELVDGGLPPENVGAAPPVVRAIQQEMYQQAPGHGGGPAYRFPESLPPAGETVQITGANEEPTRPR